MYRHSTKVLSFDSAQSLSQKGCDDTVVCGRVPGCTSTGWVGLCFFGSMSRNSQTQPAVVLVLKRLRRQGNSLKSHPTDWETRN